MALLKLYDGLEPYEKGYEDAYMKRKPNDASYHFLGVDWRSYWRGYNNGQEERDRLRAALTGEAA